MTVLSNKEEKYKSAEEKCCLIRLLTALGSIFRDEHKPIKLNLKEEGYPGKHRTASWRLRLHAVLSLSSNPDIVPSKLKKRKKENWSRKCEIWFGIKASLKLQMTAELQRSADLGSISLWEIKTQVNKCHVSRHTNTQTAVSVGLMGNGGSHNTDRAAASRCAPGLARRPDPLAARCDTLWSAHTHTHLQRAWSRTCAQFTHTHKC